MLTLSGARAAKSAGLRIELGCGHAVIKACELSVCREAGLDGSPGCTRRLTHCEDNVELRLEGIFAVSNLHDQLRAKQTVGAVAFFIGKIELGSQQCRPGRLDLYMIVPCATRIETRQNGVEGVVPLGVGEKVAAQAEALIVVFAVIVRVPQINKGTRERPASAS